MKPYLDLINHVIQNGEERHDRTGIGTLSVFGDQTRYDLRKGLPLVTTKKIHLKSIIHELLWFLKGETNTHYLKQNGVSIWDEWADETGNLGPIYGKQWRRWETPKGPPIDQIETLVSEIKKNPESRRLIVTAWNPSDLPAMALPPCHVLMQFYVKDRKWLSCQLYQRSADIFLGLPFNIAGYALLTMMVAQVTQLRALELIHTLGDAHLYFNHFEQAQIQRERTPYPPPQISLNPEIKNLNDFTFEDFELINYKAHPHIKAPVAI